MAAAPPPFLLTPLLLLALSLTSAAAFVHPGDLEVLEDLRRSINNPEALGWANGADPCASPRVSCDRSGRVSNLDLTSANLSGELPASFSNLQALQSLKLKGNSLSGPLPSFRGMAALRHACLSGNSFDTIPSDFFDGLRHLEVMVLTNNYLLNASAGGWAIPPGLATSAPQLRVLWLQNSGLVGGLPESLGAMAGLQQLRLSYNHLSGPLPASFRGSRIQVLTLSNQRLSGSLAVLAGMVSLSSALLDGNQFAGTVPEDIDACQNLTRLWLNRNVLVGLLPQALANLPKLKDIRLDNNYFLGPAPALKANATFFHNGICGEVCAPEVMSLLNFLGNVGYPQRLAASWSGNDPCSDWPGVVCYEGRVSQLNLPGYGLNGTISSSLGKLTMLWAIRLNGNNLTGQVPSSLTELRLLKNLDLSKNNLAGPLPAFSPFVNVNVTGNPNFSAHPSNSHQNRTRRLGVVLGVTIPAALILIALISLAVVKLCCKKKGPSKPQPQTNAIVVHPQDSPTRHSFKMCLQVLRVATNNFSQENVLGSGGFGIVYKGVLHDGTVIAVKRMMSTVISNKPIDDFQAEIAILKVRHRNLVSILGYSVEDNERLLVYEHMSNGSLNKHLFRWKLLGLEPLSWKKRLSIALDVARGMEYLHSLAQNCYIHRDLKPANILLGDDFQAKVADFGLLRPAPDRNASVKTNVAGTMGYLAPEYAATGKVTTKADVFSFGVMLMELITGLTAIDEQRVGETYYLPSWFRQIQKEEETLRAAIDPALVVTDELKSVSAIAELAGHCTAPAPSQRPDMGYVVTALSPMVEKWKPSSSEAEDIDLHPPLLQMVKDWKESDARMTDGGVLSLQDVSADGR